MGYFDTSRLKPEGSIVAGVAVAGFVYSIYQLDMGPVSQVHMTDPNHPALESSRKKAGYTAFIGVAILTVLSKDMNVGILGFGSIIAMEAHYRHAIMAEAATGEIVPPSPTKYEPAQDVVPQAVQGPVYADFGAGY